MIDTPIAPVTATTNGPGHTYQGNGSLPNLTSDENTTLADMRPALIIGAGGTGQQVITFLKAILLARFGPTAWKTKIKLLAFDTADEAFTVASPQGEIRLEPGAELFNIGNVPVPSIMHNIEGLEAIRERLGPILPSLPPVVLRSGAKQLRPFGLLSLLWNYKLVNDELRRAIWILAGRDQAQSSHQGQGINIFICGSLVGGTGSGTFLDLAHLVRAIFTDLGSQAEFCQITGIGLLPQAFTGISGPNLYPNTAAALQELNHLMVKTGFRSRYPDGRTIVSKEAPFNLFYLIDGVDERGQTWSGITAVCSMTAEGIYLQMSSQLGRKGENAFDNLNEALTGQTANGEGTFYSSFGLGYLLFDAPAISHYCTQRFLYDLIRTGWLGEHPERNLSTPLANLTAEKLRQCLLQDSQTGSDIQVDLPVPGWLLTKRPEEITSEATRYSRGYGQARVAEMFLPQINQNGALLLVELQQGWTTWIQENLLDPELGLTTVTSTLSQVQNTVLQWADGGQKKMAELTRRLERLTETVAQMETLLARAATSFPLGRQERIRAALSNYFQAVQALYENQVRRQRLNGELTIWNSLLTLLQNYHEAATTLEQRLRHLANRLEESLPQAIKQLANHGVSHVSLADEVYVDLLYQKHKPTWADVKQQMGNPLPLCTLATEALAKQCYQALQGNFNPIARLTVESVLQERAGEMTPRARRQQLFRLATPSWNVNRARLPEGGAGLVRLEVMGVPDAMNTEYGDEPMLVSTRDPYRLVALVVVAGAPQSALQQYELFCQYLERERGRPFHVLPDFLTGADQARLAFALGSIFGLIYNQGTFFYYRPADVLATPVQLANGLTNALQAFLARDGLAHEVSERVGGQIAQMGLREAITLLTEYYTTTPNGNTRLDEQTRELKRLVRDYTEDLRGIDEFSTGVKGKGRSEK